MNFKGDKTLPKLFIPFLAILGIILGEIIPVAMEPDPSAAGAKVSIFANWFNFIATVTVYCLLGWLFWWLYKKYHWLIIAGIAAILGAIMEFTFMRPQEANGPNVVENPLSALLFFVIIWPILMLIPYGIFQLLRKLIFKNKQEIG